MAKMKPCQSCGRTDYGKLMRAGLCQGCILVRIEFAKAALVAIAPKFECAISYGELADHAWVVADLMLASAFARPEKSVARRQG